MMVPRQTTRRHRPKRRKPSETGITLVQAILETLRAEIASGEVPPGELLSRRTLASRFRCSYSTVVEVMVRLEGAELIEAETAQMARVVRPTLERIRDAHVLIEAYETQAIRLACLSATAGEIDELYLLAEALEQRIATTRSRRPRGTDAARPVPQANCASRPRSRPGAGARAQPVAGSLSEALDRDRDRNARSAAVAFRVGRRHSRPRPPRGRCSHAGPHAPGIRKRSVGLSVGPRRVEGVIDAVSAAKTQSRQSCARANGGLARRSFLKTAVAAAAAGSMGTSAWGAPAAGSSVQGANPSEKAILALYRTLSDEQRRAVCFDWDYRVDIRYGRKPLTIPDPNGVTLRTHVSNAWLITPQLDRQSVLYRRAARADSRSRCAPSSRQAGWKSFSSKPATTAVCLGGAIKLWPFLANREAAPASVSLQAFT